VYGDPARSSALIAQGEVLVAGTDADPGIQLLRRLGFRILSNAWPLLRLWRAVVIKGFAVPAATRLDPGDRPIHGRSDQDVRVAVVDTGIDRDAVEASNGWLAGIDVEDGRDGNRDLLDR
jgi:hypothetical protein